MHTKGHALCYVFFLVCLCWSVIIQTQRTRDVYFLAHLMDDKLLQEEFQVEDAHVKDCVFDRNTLQKTFCVASRARFRSQKASKKK